MLKFNVYVLPRELSGFSYLVEELSSWQSGSVADLPDSPPKSREFLGNDCSSTTVTTRSVLHIVMKTVSVAKSFLRLFFVFVVFLFPTSKNCRCDFRVFLVVAKIQGQDVSLFSNEFLTITSSLQIVFPNAFN